MDAIVTGHADPVTAPEIVEAGRADSPSAGTDTVLRTSHLVRLRQPIAGTVLELSAVPDPTFSGEVMGPGIAVEPEDGTVVAPAAGPVKHVIVPGPVGTRWIDYGTAQLLHIGWTPLMSSVAEDTC